VQDQNIEPLIGANLPFNIGELRLVIFASILILTMILRPQGIFGTAEIGNIYRRYRSKLGKTGGLE